jgi:hypothetical protein
MSWMKRIAKFFNKSNAIVKSMGQVYSRTAPPLFDFFPAGFSVAEEE